MFNLVNGKRKESNTSNYYTNKPFSVPLPANKDTVPPLFPVEDDKDYIRGLLNPIFERVLKERLPDSMTTPPAIFSYLWRPHNYRRQMRVKSWFDSGYSKLRSAINSAYFKPTGVKIAFNFNERVKMVSIKGLYDNITLQLCSHTLVAIYKQNIINGEKETYLLESNSFQEVEDWIINKKKLISERLDYSIKDFLFKTDLLIPDEVIIWSRFEDWIKGDDYLDKIPRECVIHDTVFKKVYQEGVEFKGGRESEPIVYMKNYIKNRALEDFNPMISEALNGLAAGMVALRKEALEPLTEQIKLHLEVQQATLKALTDVSSGIRGLNDKVAGLGVSVSSVGGVNMESDKSLDEWVTLNEEIERSRIKRFPYKSVLKVTLTQRITTLRINGLTKEAVFNIIKEELRPFLTVEGCNDVFGRLWISVCARYGEQKSFTKRAGL